MAARIILEVTEGPLLGRESSIRCRPGAHLDGRQIVLEGWDVFLFGRMPDCHVRLPEDDLDVSRHHCLLECSPPQAILRDLGSLHGTYVNGTKYGGRPRRSNLEPDAAEPACEAALDNGDRIAIGATLFRVRVEMPRVCASCGIEDPANVPSSTRDAENDWFCEACQSRPSASAPADRSASRRVCSECGQPLRHSAAPRETIPLCAECARHSPAAADRLASRLLRRAEIEREGAPLPHVPSYECLEKLGRGSFGEVYLARREGETGHCALKLLTPCGAVTHKARSDFLREIEITGRLAHPHIVRLLDAGFGHGVFYLATEYCDGGNVQQLAERAGGFLPLTDALRILQQSLDALAFIHRANLVHRDLKPTNLLLLGAADRYVVKLADLGLAKDYALAGLSGMTLVGHYAGTFEFMPREQLTSFRYLKPCSDVWSIAATFYHLVTGEYPLDFPPGEDKAALVLESRVVPIRQRDPGFSPAIAAVIDRSLAVRPEDRFNDAEQMRQALLDAL